MSTPNSTNAATATTTRRGRLTVAEIRERALHLDRLWVIEDIATFLGFSGPAHRRDREGPTRPPAPPEADLAAQERAIFAAIDATRTFEVTSGHLTLFDGDGHILVIAAETDS
jgi:hypothetical protein